MARGEGGLLNQAAKTASGNAQSIYGTTTNATSKIIANPGPTPTQTNQMIEAAAAPVANTNAAAATRLAQRAAAGSNSAGLVAGERALARQGGQQASQATLGAQTTATKMGEDELTKALQINQGLYGSTTGETANLYSTAQKANPGFRWNLGFGPNGASAGFSG